MKTIHSCTLSSWKKGWLILGAVAGLHVSSAQAALLVYEGFDGYAAGSLTGQTTGTGTGWTATSWSTSTDSGASSMAVTTSGLTYTDGTDTLVTSPNAAQDVGLGAPGNTRTWDTSFITDGTVLWFSVLVNQTAAASDLRFFPLSADTNVSSGNTNDGGIFISGTNNTVAARAGATTSATLAAPSLGTTFLVVGQIQFSTLSNDTVTVWVDPDLSTEPFSGGVSAAGDIAATSIFGFRSGGSWVGRIDEFRVGTTFADVVPVPEPATGLYLAAGLAGGWALLRRRR